MLTLDILGAVGLDLFFRGQSVWHISLNGSAIQLRRAAFWDMVERDRWSLTLPRPTGTDTIKALGDEVLSLTIGASPETPWQGCGPLSADPGHHSLGTANESNPRAAHRSLAVVTSKKDYGHHTGGPVLNSSALT
ncbi:hypothetical protein [Paracoccus sp. N5]|uniref:hypothetical protein n=1 Tax=Paracoccus sp. N5 TaxID=1101189 RepID=UPI00055A2713|nr:hypothetical protein [Paracoccus sp. N5]